MNIHFQDKTVLVTGAAHGFGRAIALAFATRGAQVWACDLLANEVAETAALCQAAGGICTAQQVDVTDHAAVGAWVATATAPAGKPIFWSTMLVVSSARWGGRWKRLLPPHGRPSLM